MKRDTIVFTICGFLLGLVVGSFLIGPYVTQKKNESAPPQEVVQQPQQQAQPQQAAPNANAMDAVRQQIAALKSTIALDPKNFDALVQLGNMYMDAAKYSQALEYYERALAVREDGNVRTDLGICYKQSGDLAKSLAAFQKAADDSPGQWQALFNQAIVLHEMHRTADARAIVAKVEQIHPNDPEVDKLKQALAQP